MAPKAVRGRKPKTRRNVKKRLPMKVEKSRMGKPNWIKSNEKRKAAAQLKKDLAQTASDRYKLELPFRRVAIILGQLIAMGNPCLVFLQRLLSVLGDACQRFGPKNPTSMAELADRTCHGSLTSTFSGFEFGVEGGGPRVFGGGGQCKQPVLRNANSQELSLGCRLGRVPQPRRVGYPACLRWPVKLAGMRSLAHSTIVAAGQPLSNLWKANAQQRDDPVSS